MADDGEKGFSWKSSSDPVWMLGVVVIIGWTVCGMFGFSTTGIYVEVSCKLKVGTNGSTLTVFPSTFSMCDGSSGRFVAILEILDGL